MKYFFTKMSLLLAATFLISATAMAQFTASGTVTDGEGEALIGVSVVVKGTALGTVTDFDGNYSVNVPGQSGVLEFSYIGFANVTQEVSSSNSTADVVLSDAATQLDAVVVTGLATNVKRSNLANSVANINAKQLTGIAVQSTMDGALYGKFKGADIRSNSGAPGGGMSIKLRGVTSIFGNQQPLYIVDGVYVDNSSISQGTNVVSSAAGGGNTATNQDDASNRIADIDPEDIESIEILKGASAAAIYGSRAAGGVVIISTKKGQAGKTKVTVSQSIGQLSAITLLGTRAWDVEKVRQVFGDADAAKAQSNGINDYEKELYGNTRWLRTSRLSLSGGNEKTKFFVGSTYKNDQGLVQNTGYEKFSIRANIDHKLTDWLDLSVSNNYINSSSDRGFFNNSNSNTTVGYALAFTRPWENLFPDANGNYPANPTLQSNVLETVALITNNEKVNRYIGGGTLTAKLLTTENQSLKLVARAGLDQYTLRTTGLFPQTLQFYRNPSSLRGVSISGSTVNTNINLSAFLVHSYYTSSGISFRTQLGVTQENFDQNTVISTATGLNGSQTNIDQATNLAGFQNKIIQQDKGFFVQEEVNFNDQIILTAGLRGDKSSNNGDANQLYFYPKGSVALNLGEFDFWSVDALSTFKLRAAYGESGRFSNFPDRFTILDGSVIGGNSGLANNTLLGNDQVGPERQSELEAGLDIGLVDNKVLLDITYYNKSIDDLLLRSEVPTSTGFTRKVVNAGALQNQGIELGLNLNFDLSENLSWTSTTSFWLNRSKITRLDIPAFNLGGFAASLGRYRIEEGSSATQIIGTYNPDTCPECPGLDPDGDGFAVFGDAEADFNMSFLNSFTIAKNLDLSFLIHWKQGSEGINLSTLLYDLANLTWDYDDLTLDPNGQVPNGDFRKNSFLADGNPAPFIENTGYVRLREIGLYYRIPKATFNDIASVRLGISANNLINIFDYNSYDPEVSNFGGNVLANNVEVTPFPSSKRWNFIVSVNF